MYQNQYTNNLYLTEEQIQEQILNEKKHEEKRALRKRCISTGLLSLICLFAFSILAIIFLLVFEYALADTPLKDNPKLSLIPDMMLNSIVSLIGFGVVGVIFAKVTKTDFNEIFPHKNFTFKKLAGVVAIGFTVCISANYIAQLFSVDLRIFGLETNYDMSSTGSTSLLEHIVYIISVSFVPAVTEELVYRGCIMGRLRKYGDGFALVTSAFLFGIMHGNFTQAPFAFVVGLAVGWAVIYTGSIIPAMIIHGLNNFMSVIADICYENFEIMNFDTVYVDLFYMIFYVAMFLLALAAVYKFSKSDKNFAKFEPYKGVLTFKERIKTFATTFTIIIFTAITLLECLMMLQFIE